MYLQHDSSTSLKNAKVVSNNICMSQAHRVIPVEPSINTELTALGYVKNMKEYALCFPNSDFTPLCI